MRMKLSQFMKPAGVKKTGLPLKSPNDLYWPAFGAYTAMNDSIGYAYQVWTIFDLAGL